MIVTEQEEAMLWAVVTAPPQQGEMRVFQAITPGEFRSFDQRMTKHRFLAALRLAAWTREVASRRAGKNKEESDE